MTAATVAAADQELVLNLVAEWMGTKGFGPWLCPEGRATDYVLRHVDDGTDCDHGKCGPAPTGPDAARNGLGPMLLPEWDWPSNGPTPAIILEGGPDDWPMEACWWVQDRLKAAGRPVFVEPYSGWALCLYPD